MHERAQCTLPKQNWEKIKTKTRRHADGGETKCVSFGHFGDRTIALTSGFDFQFSFFQHGVFCQCSVVTVTLQCTVFELGPGTDKRTKRGIA